MSDNTYDSGRLNLPFVGICTFGKYPYIQDWNKIDSDIAILGAVIISWMLNTNLKIEPLIISKFNTFFQIFYIALIFIIIINDRYFISFQNTLFELTTYLIALLTVVSWLSYLRVWLFNMSEADKSNLE